jgi:ketosteroid isomerase-like protein
MDENPTQDNAIAALPDAIARYLTAHRAHDDATGVTAFTPDATVVDDGRTYEGTTAIRAWLERSSREFTYTTELMGSERIDDSRSVVLLHLAGDFPGGEVDLRYQFTLTDGVIERLVIEP